MGEDFIMEDKNEKRLKENLGKHSPDAVGLLSSIEDLTKARISAKRKFNLATLSLKDIVHELNEEVEKEKKVLDFVKKIEPIKLEQSSSKEEVEVYKAFADLKNAYRRFNEDWSEIASEIGSITLEAEKIVKLQKEINDLIQERKNLRDSSEPFNEGPTK